MGAAPGSRSSRLILTLLAALLCNACSVVATRPRQEMANTAAAIRAAREVSADSVAPEFFREAEEWYFKARQEYRLKNFARSRDAADRARVAAEKAEFQAILGGSKRVSINSTSEAAPEPVAPEATSPAPEAAPVPAPSSEPEPTS